MLEKKYPKRHLIYTIAVIGSIYTIHLVLPMYSNSSFLNLFTDEKTMGYVYMAGSIASIFGFMLAPDVIRKIGNYRTTMALVLAQILFFYIIISSSSATLIIAAFIMQMATAALIALNLDIFLEMYSNKNQIGSVRGLYMATINTSWLVGPLIGGLLINGTNNFRSVYIASFFMLLPLFYLVYRNFPRFHDPHYTHPFLWQLIKNISSNRNWTKIFIANIILQTFYAWMVVYSPIYLNIYMGFSWIEIGFILTIMLLPFTLIQYPLGKLADKKYGEKEIMTLGFIIIGLSTICLAFIKIPSVMVWAAALFATRVGAASAEIMIETYFFKTVSPNYATVLSSFRMTRPLSYFFAPLITYLGLMFTTHQNLFILVGLISLLGLYPALTIKDTN